MSDPTLRRTPTFRDVIGAELRSLAIGLRPVALLAFLVLAVVTAVVSIDLVQADEGLYFIPEMGILVVALAIFLPIAVWKGEYNFRRSYLASMPVDRNRHVWSKIAAGWMWLMAALVVYLVWMFAWAWITDGTIGTYWGVPADELSPNSSPEEALALVRRLDERPWQWLAVFSGSTIAYLLGSAVVLAGRRPRRWLAGLVIVLASIMFIDDEIVHLGGVAERIDVVLIMMIEGRYGLETLLEGRRQSALETAAGERVNVFYGPDLGQWLLATLLWLVLGASGVYAALRRDR